MAIRLEAAKPATASAPPGPIREFWHYFSENQGAVGGLVVIVIVVLAALFADQIAPYPPAEQFRDHFLAPPFWMAGGRAEFLLGTDAVGRDILYASSTARASRWSSA